MSTDMRYCTRKYKLYKVEVKKTFKYSEGSNRRRVEMRKRKLAGNGPVLSLDSFGPVKIGVAYHEGRRYNVKLDFRGE
jgi:hypothetical protein